MRVRTLIDGLDSVPLSAFPAADNVRASELAERRGVSISPIIVQINAFLVETPSQRLLIDAGAGSLMGEKLGRIENGLAKLSIDADDIDTILMTHLHVDHAGGLIKDGARRFRKAKILMQEDEMRFWRASASNPQSPWSGTASAATATAVFDSYGQSIALFPAGATICDNVTAYPLPGHTPGHTGFLIQDDAQRLLIWGDIVHAPFLQIPIPEWGHRADVNSVEAIRTRKSVLERACAEELPIAGSHIPNSGFGLIRQTAIGYTIDQS